MATPPSSSASTPPPSDSTPPPPPLLDTAPPVSHLPPSTPPPETQPPPSKADPPPGALPPESPPPSSPPPTPPSSNSPPRESAPPGDSPPQPSANYFPPPDSGPPPSGSFPPPPHGRTNLSPSPPPTEQMLPPPDHSSSGPPTTPVPRKVWSPPRPPPPGNPSNFSPYGSRSGNNNGVKPSMAVGIGAAIAFAVIFVAVVICCMRKKKKRYRGGYNGDYQHPSPFSSQQASGTTTPFSKSPSVPLMQNNPGSAGYSYSPPDSGIGNSKSWFTYEELAQATNGFSYQNLLGEGGFGCVYKGFLPDGREVAVKQLKVGGAQGEREFQAEVEIISRVHHRHLVSLVGYCISENQRLLVYDYVPNNTLHYHLHGHGRPVMDWETRVKVAAGAARGLAYLHEDCHPRIIHRDIKTSNILLDNNFEAQVSDFGLAKLTADTNTHVTTRVMGTFGYLAPEYASSGKLTDRSDVFSFGVVLLEIITGRRPVDSSQPLGEESLVEWARPLMIMALETGNFDQLPDPRLSNDYNEREMFQMIEAASACVRYNAQMRPRMGRVVRVLDSIADSMDLNNGVKPGQTKVFNGPTSVEDMKNFHKMAFGSQDYSSDFSRTSWKN